MGLNAEQQMAVECAGNLLVLAPPGSGKTGTLVAKTKFILDLSPKNVVMLVTFTDASAKEAKERILKAIGPANAKRVKVATFHSHGLQQLRENQRLGRVLTPSESTQLVRQALKQIDSSEDLFDAESTVQNHKSNPDFTGTEDELIAAYEQLKRSHRAIDLQDVIRECVNGMRGKHSEGPLKPIACTHVLCDEFQDVDLNQLNWLICYKEIAGAILTAVGDDDQSIYGWRASLGYAAVEAYIRATNPTIINLEVNYRSHSEIIVQADALIRNNAMRMPKTLISSKGEGGSVCKISFPSKEDEAEYVLERVLEDVEDREGRLWVRPGRWGIIARNNRDLWLIAGKLRQRGIPIKASKRDPAPPEVMGFCALLGSIATNDTIGLRRALDDIGVSHASYSKVEKHMGDGFYLLMDNELPEIELPIEDRRLIQSFASMCAKWRRLLEMEQPAYSRVIAACGDWYADNTGLRDDTKSDLCNFANMLASGKGDIKRRLDSFFMQNDAKGDAGVNILTMHGSKGLEYDRVYLANCNVGTIPSPKTHSIEEERRLFYVAMTRARSDLHIGFIASKGASSFLSEF